MVSAYPAEMPLPGQSQRRRTWSIGKREAVEVMSRLPSLIGLSFLSTLAKGTMNPFQPYDYLSPAGAGIRVYMLDTGVNTSHLAFDSIWIE